MKVSGLRRLKSLREGNTLVVWQLDRLGYRLANLVHLTNEIQSDGIHLESMGKK